jgi:glycosyltransferase involved in cell wall biosynthesis
MNNKLITILIPTYNRSPYLRKNIELLSLYILNNALDQVVSIIVSDNASTDNTRDFLTELENGKNIDISIFHQKENIGLEKNALFVLNKAISKYVMYLGDDDYIDEKYLIDIVKKLKKETEIYCVLPAFRRIDYDGTLLQGGRDLNVKSEIYDKGFNNCLINSNRGHQLSGVVLYNERLSDSYTQNKVNNLYPFIYFVAYCCLRGKTWHFTDYPVLVTAAEQKDKDWGYGKDGLISDIFDNYKKLKSITPIQRGQLEIRLLRVQSWRYEMYLGRGILPFINVIWHIEFGKNTSWITKFLFPFLIIKSCVKSFIKKAIKFICLIYSKCH